MTQQAKPARTCADPVPDQYVVFRTTPGGLVEVAGAIFDSYPEAEDRREAEQRQAPNAHFCVHGVYL